MSKRPELMVVSGAMSGRRFEVKDGGLRLGRSSSNDIHVPDEELSRNHCLFEVSSDDRIRVTDLASANGTYLNGKLLGSDPAELAVGDVITAGGVRVRVVGDEPPKNPALDLGFGAGAPPPQPTAGASKKSRSPVANILWGVVVLTVIAAVGVVLFAPVSSEPDQTAAPLTDEGDLTLKEAYYEKVEATSDGIFRYEMTLSPDGVLKATVDDVPKENRHLVRSEQLNPEALALIGEILSFKALREIDREYVGVEPDPPALTSWSLKTVYGTRARRIRIVNTQEPEAFRAIRERLEAFSKNQLGIWALQYSREKLVSLAEEAIVLGKAKWDEREVQYGNLHAAIVAYKEAIFYLETVNPKPPCIEAARRGLKEASTELEERYRKQGFLADRALKLGQWVEARKELGILLEMVPDRNDERYREASAKLVDIENRMKGGK